MDPFAKLDRQSQPITEEQWAALHAKEEYRFVLRTRLADAWVITIWDGMDPYRFERDFDTGPHLIFETTVFRPAQEGNLRLDGDDQRWAADESLQQRHATEAEALTFHQALVERIGKP